MKRVEVITRWLGDGVTRETAFRPELADHYPLRKWEDTTNGKTPADPNSFVAEVVMEDADYLLLSTDLRYDGCILSVEEA